MSAKKLNATSILLARSAKDWGVQMHKHLIALTSYVETSKDVSVFDVLIRELSNISTKTKESHSIVRVDAIKTWIEAFGFARIKTDEKTGKKRYALATKAYESASADNFKAHNAKARVTTWNKYTPAPKDLDSAFEIDKVIARHLKAIEDDITNAKTRDGKYKRQTEKARERNVYESELLAKIRELKAA